ncbi:general substrate transporter [Clavulina sp. PMI_390]|nr:general substrate transporter [Clavulina sp. PMI_390]
MSTYYAAITIWALISPFQYGYHTAGLNQIQDVLTCQKPVANALPLPSDCVEMSKTVFGIVTASFTLGGFLGSSFASYFLERWGRRGSLIINSMVVALGSAFFSASSTINGLMFGRFLIGIGCGLGLCALPLYLAETAPARLKDKVGVLNQLSITIGILATQAIGLPLARSSQWRPVPFASALLGVAHAALGVFVNDTPAWLAAKGRHSEAESVSRTLHGLKDGESLPSSSQHASGRSTPARIDTDAEVRAALLAPSSDEPESPELMRPSSLVPPTESVGVLELITTPDLRRALFIVSLAMIAQQFSGINAVIYYSTDILKEALTVDAGMISVLISVVNVVMTFAPIILIGKFGTKRLLMLSIFGAFISVVALGRALDRGLNWLSSLAILTFVASFALGLGPVPFMLTADLVPYYAASSLSAFALALNCKCRGSSILGVESDHHVGTANFIVGVSFLPLRDLLASIGSGDGSGDHPDTGKGRVFYVFAAMLALVAATLRELFKRR